MGRRGDDDSGSAPPKRRADVLTHRGQEDLVRLIELDEMLRLPAIAPPRASCVLTVEIVPARASDRAVWHDSEVGGSSAALRQEHLQVFAPDADGAVPETGDRKRPARIQRQMLIRLTPRSVAAWETL